MDAPAVERDSLDRRFATVRWHPVEGADGYLVRFGIAPDFMNQCIQVKGGQRDSRRIPAIEGQTQIGVKGLSTDGQEVVIHE